MEAATFTDLHDGGYPIVVDALDIRLLQTRKDRLPHRDSVGWWPLDWGEFSDVGSVSSQAMPCLGVYRQDGFRFIN
jgi:hypothetical protein